MPDRDELYNKYVVCRWPEDIDLDPEAIESIQLAYGDRTGKSVELETVGDPFFVLKPAGDYHARVALAAYLWSCRAEFPQLSSDLESLLELSEVEAQRRVAREWEAIRGELMHAGGSEEVGDVDGTEEEQRS